MISQAYYDKQSSCWDKVMHGWMKGALSEWLWRISCLWNKAMNIEHYVGTITNSEVHESSGLDESIRALTRDKVSSARFGELGNDIFLLVCSIKMLLNGLHRSSHAIWHYTWIPIGTLNVTDIDRLDIESNQLTLPLKTFDNPEGLAVITRSHIALMLFPPLALLLILTCL